ncbi:MAG: hypothetical protein GYA59_12885 [Chloroflexi bacterium]|nr:hypothetical protein [Chloroflexota bacterium]
MEKRQPVTQNNWVTLAFAALAIIGGGSLAFFVTTLENPLLLIFGFAGLLAVFAVMAKPEWGLYLLVFLGYTRFSDVAIAEHGLPSVLKPLIAIVGLAILVRCVIYRKHPVGWGFPSLLIGAYGLVGFISLLHADDYISAQGAVIAFAKDAIIAIFVIFLLQRARALRYITWVLLGAGIFLGTISVYQYLTRSFSSAFWGFGQAVYMNIVGQTNGYRLTGPFGDPNPFAQAMVVLVPLALDRLFSEKHPLLRILAGWALLTAILTTVFTFSRGGFIALAVISLAFLLWRRFSLPTIVLLLLLILIVFTVMPTEYTARIQSLTSLFSPDSGGLQSEASFRGRASELSVGWLMFLDHPILGVGLNNYPSHYIEYSSLVGLDPRFEERSAHDLYIEIAAEQGIFGLLIFGLLLWYIFRGLLWAKSTFRSIQMPAFANLTVAFITSLIGYLTCALFLHNAYPRQFWLLVGIAMAIPLIARKELEEYRSKTAGD